MWRLPLWTANVRPTKSGVMVERRDQVLIAGGRLAPARISSTFFSRCRSMNGPFLTERAITFRFAPLQRDEGGGMRDEGNTASHPLSYSSLRSEERRVGKEFRCRWSPY